MAKPVAYITKVLHEASKIQSLESISKQIAPRSQQQIEALDKSVFSTTRGETGQAERLAYLNEKEMVTDHISGSKKLDDLEKLTGNIENFIGMAQVPIGLADYILMVKTRAAITLYPWQPQKVRL